MLKPIFILVRNVTSFPPSCPQIVRPGSLIQPRLQNEDCLYLNIWTPLKVKNPVPVMVFLHGGSWQYGSTNAPDLYYGHAFANSGVILVTLNYRLGVNDFFSFFINLISSIFF